MTGLIGVTGAAGLVGQAVVARLLAGESRVRAITRPGGTALPADLEPTEHVLADVRQSAHMQRAVRGCSVIIHAAALMQGPDDDIRGTNLNGTLNVLKAIKGEGIGKLVFVSTVAVYGSGDLEQVDEDRPANPDGAYACSKLSAEQAVQDHAEDGLEAWTLRLCTVYGPPGTPLTSFLLALAREGVIPLVRGGEILVDLVSAQDAAQACVQAATTPTRVPRRVHIASGRRTTVLDVVERLRRDLALPALTVDVPDPTHPPDGVPIEVVQMLAEHRSFRIERARRLLDYRPESSFPQIPPPL